MSYPSLRRTACAVVLAATLSTSWAAAAEAKRATPPKTSGQAATGLLVRAWNLLTNLWSEEGCYIDPDGRCASHAVAAAVPKTESGCYIDPSGGCYH